MVPSPDLIPDTTTDELVTSATPDPREDAYTPPAPPISVGRIVHYVLPDGHGFRDRAVGQIRPAIVVHVWGPETGYPPGDQVVQLQVFLDGTNDVEVGGASARSLGATYWATSVRHDEGKAGGTWHWPARVA
jgi:hypothetical protein